MGLEKKREADGSEAGPGPVTIEEFARMPEDEHYTTELVRGWIVREPLPMPPHARTTARVTRFLDEFVEKTGLGVVLAEMGFVVDAAARTVRGPDVAFVSRERIPKTWAEGFWYFGPDLAVEVLSPSNRPAQMREKVQEYFAAGSRVVWIVDPLRRTVTVQEREGGEVVVPPDGILYGGEVLPGFELPLARLFAA